MLSAVLLHFQVINYSYKAIKIGFDQRRNQLPWVIPKKSLYWEAIPKNCNKIFVQSWPYSCNIRLMSNEAIHLLYRQNFKLWKLFLILIRHFVFFLAFSLQFIRKFWKIYLASISLLESKSFQVADCCLLLCRLDVLHCTLQNIIKIWKWKHFRVAPEKPLYLLLFFMSSCSHF